MSVCLDTIPWFYIVGALGLLGMLSAIFKTWNTPSFETIPENFVFCFITAPVIAIITPLLIFVIIPMIISHMIDKRKTTLKYKNL